MVTIISILIFIACCLLVLAVLIQNPKGGGLASGFQSGAQVMGVRRTADFLEKATWTLAVAILVMSVASTTLSKGEVGVTETESSSTIEKSKENQANPGTTPAPAPAIGTPQPAPPAGGGQ
jgi:preprotein translocase subunit SecG